MAPDPLRAVAESVQTGFLKQNAVLLMWTAEPEPTGARDWFDTIWKDV